MQWTSSQTHQKINMIQCSAGLSFKYCVGLLFFFSFYPVSFHCQTLLTKVLIVSRILNFFAHPLTKFHETLLERSTLERTFSHADINFVFLAYPET